MRCRTQSSRVPADRLGVLWSLLLPLSIPTLGDLFSQGGDICQVRLPVARPQVRVTRVVAIEVMTVVSLFDACQFANVFLGRLVQATEILSLALRKVAVQLPAVPAGSSDIVLDARVLVN